MTKNPFINALLATGYISILVTLIFNSPKIITDNELGMMLPIIMLSALVFSAALMGYLFVYQPGLLILVGKRDEGAKLFLMTVFAFACITIAIILAFFLLTAVL